MTDKTRKALERLCSVFPTDADMADAGWMADEIERACDAYDAARAALAAPVDAAGAPKPEATVLERAAIQALNAVKAWRDSDGNEPFPHDARMLIDAVLAMGEQRRTALATHNPIPPLDEPMLNGLTEAETTATASVTGLSTERRDVSPQADALGYATRLATAIHAKHYSTVAPQWKPLPDLMGVLTQIDNMTSGLRPPAVEAEPVARAPYITDEQVTEWADNRIRTVAFNRPVAVQIAIEAAKWVRDQYEPSLNGLSDALRKEIESPIFMGEPVIAAPLQQPQEGRVSVPLTKERIDFIIADSFLAANGSVYSTRVYDFVRAIEEAHGIAAAPSQGEGEV